MPKVIERLTLARGFFNKSGFDFQHHIQLVKNLNPIKVLRIEKMPKDMQIDFAFLKQNVRYMCRLELSNIKVGNLPPTKLIYNYIEKEYQKK